MKGKTILVTGGTGGIGFQIAKGLLALGARVLVTGRDEAHGEAALDALRRSVLDGDVDLLLGDLSTLSGIAAIEKGLRSTTERLDVLVNNAGAIPPATRQLTEDGFQPSFVVNVVAPWVLARALSPQLSRSGGGRVVNVTGGRPGGGPVRTDNLQGEREYSAMQLYNQDKMAMMAATYVQAGEFLRTGVTHNVVYPGFAGTQMTSGLTSGHFPVGMRWLLPLMRPLMGRARPEKASRSSVYAASAGALAGRTRLYLNTRGKEAPWPKAATDGEVQTAVLDALAEILPRAGTSSNAVALC